MTTPDPKPAMSLSDFYDELERFDWYYDYSDDHSVWIAGMRERDRLEKIANTSIELRALYDGFHKHHFTGEPWSSEKQPKPERPAS